MKRLQRAAVMTSLVEKLRAAGSWCGETHVQKATYFLQSVMDIPLGYRFILYKHGPYSFDLNSEIVSMLADDLLKLHLRLPSYGPSILTSEGGERVRERFPKTLADYGRQIEIVAGWLGDRGAAELERLATALYVMRVDLPDSDSESRARRINELKPHVSLQEGEQAIRAVQQFMEQARKALSVA